MKKSVGRILIIEDDLMHVSTLSAYCDEEQIDWDAVSSLDELDVTLALKPDLILLDIQLGFSDAFALMRRLAEGYTGVVSIMSGLGLSVIMDATIFGEKIGLFMGMALPKPISPGDFRNALASAAALLRQKKKSGYIAGARAMRDSERPLRLAEALSSSALLWYQPKFLAHGKVIIGGEALIRARAPNGRIVNPKELLSGATTADLNLLTEYVLRETAGHSLLLAGLGFDQPLSVNIPISFLFGSDPVHVIREAATNNLWPGMIFEVTEEAALDDFAELQIIATQLSLYNVRLSIDDFGAGYSSFARLRDVPFRELKLDRSFVSGCAADTVKRSICLNVLRLGWDLGLDIVCEGVEAEEDLQFLTEHGGEQMQGYYFAKPMPFDRFRAKIERQILNQRSQGALKLQRGTELRLLNVGRVA